MAALAAVFFVGPRTVKERGPHSIPLVALGTGLLWFGWYGFNAGSELQVDEVTVSAFLNTDVAASFAAITWLILAYLIEKKPTFVGLLTGAVAGLATITPAAGFVSVTHAMVIGIVAGVVCYLAVLLKNRMKWDDALDVWGVHGVGGIIGTIMLGIFATTTINSAGADGLLYGGTNFFMVQVGAVEITGVYAFFFTWIALWLIDKITPVKVGSVGESTGVDEFLHGEKAYVDDDEVI